MMSINPNLLISLCCIDSNASLLRLNAKNIYIDLRERSYYSINRYNQNIKMLILNVNYIYGFNKFKDSEGVFDMEKELGKNNIFCPSAYSLLKFFYLTGLLDTLDIIWIEDILNLNIEDLKILIKKLFYNQREICIYKFKSMKREFENNETNQVQQIEFKINEKSKEIFEKKSRKSQINLSRIVNKSYDSTNSSIGSKQPIKLKKLPKINISKLDMADKICDILRSQCTLPERKSNSNFAFQGIKGDIKNSNQNVEIQKAWNLAKIPNLDEYEELDIKENFYENTVKIHNPQKLKLQESDQNSDEETFKDSSTFLKDLNE